MITALTILRPTLWIGLLIGISFIAAPIKFKAQSLTLPVALDVGRVTFGLFSRVKQFFAAFLAAIYGAFDRAFWSLILVGLIVGLVVVQSAWVLSSLNRRAGLIISGNAVVPSSRTHMVYGAAEAMKLITLVGLVAIGIAQSPLHVP